MGKNRLGHQGIIQRYFLFIRAIKTLELPTRANISRYLEEEGFPLSESNFHKLTDDLEVFGIFLNHQEGVGYAIAKDSDEDVNRFLRLSNQLLRSEMIHNILDNHKEVYDYLLFEESATVDNTHCLEELIIAILQKRKVTIEYQKFGAKKPHVYSKWEPHYLKEYRGRWYLFGYQTESGYSITLAIDSRMSKVKLEDDFFERKQLETFEKLKRVVGLNYTQASEYFGNEKPIEIIFHITSMQKNYLDNLPLHYSQRFIKELENGWFEYQIRVLPNYELAQEFLRMGKEVVVKSPTVFVDYLKEIILEMKNQY